MRGRLFFLVLVLVQALASLRSYGFVVAQNASGKILHWNLTNINANFPTNVVNHQTRAVRYFVASDAFSAPHAAAEINAIRASFDQWQSISGTILRFEFGGLAGPTSDINTSDKTNTIFWKKGSTNLLVNGQLDDITGRHGVTYNSFSSENIQREADIVLNGVEESWFTDYNDAANPGTFIEGIATHEIGHFIGLEHAPLGGATLFARTASGVTPAAGLSPDEIAAARFLYPKSSVSNNWGTIRGKVTLNGTGILGAVVIAETAAGNAVAGTVTRAGGQYQIASLPPGIYSVRAAPLDPTNAAAPLVTGADIAAEFQSAQTAFLPGAASSLEVMGGGTSVLNLPVQQGTPPFRIGYIRPPTSNPGGITAQNSPAGIHRGAQGLFVGAYSPDFPPSAVLTLSGDGVVMGPTSFRFKVINGLNLLTAPITVLSNATPGLRTFIVQNGNDLAVANGFLEILPDHPDDNFDGLDDTFQRQYFPLFTAAEAGPGVDFDGDSFSNLQEYVAGSSPVDAASFLKLARISQDQNGTRLAWPSAPGRRYQVLVRATLGPASSWIPLGEPIIATGSLTDFLDPALAGQTQFYRVEALPLP